MKAVPFSRKLAVAVQKKGSSVVVGLDPRPEWFPEDVWADARTDDRREAVAAAIVRFNEGIIDAIHDAAVAVKPQLAFYERFGWPGMRALEKTIAHAKARGLLVIADGKRNDIGSTAAAYAGAYLGGGGSGEGGEPDSWPASGMEVDALTVNPYLGTDGMAPFLEACRERGKGLFVLARTSNPSGAELQQLPVGKGTLADRVAELVVQWNEGMPVYDGYGPIGAVVGATHPEEAASLRRRMPGVPFLVPGYGAQGAGAADARAAFDERGRGAVVNSARGILYAWPRQRPDRPGTMADYARAARQAALRMRDELARALST